MAGPSTGTLLVVSDDDRIRDEVFFDAPEGLEVLSAVDALEALKALDRITPRAVVVDLQTGRSGGFALAKDMGQTVRLAAVPVVVLIEREQDRWLAGEGGATRVLVKPVDGRAILMAVSSLLDDDVVA